jgi:carbonic anhydrase
MHRRQALKLFGALALCPICAPKGFGAEHWSYEGPQGPEKWGDLEPANRVCSVGGQQSPVDVVDTISAKLTPIKPNWARRADTIVNNGHTIQLNFAEGSKLTAPGGEYKLVQCHFHRPSEHLVNGKTYPMEVHFVHANAAGGLAVVGVLMENGKPNAMFNKIVSTMPAKEGPPVKADAAINPNGLLPSKLTYYRYPGSLTTPPCSETVDWLLLTEPIQVAAADVEAFSKLYARNARPPQKSNRRFVLRSG